MTDRRIGTRNTSPPRGSDRFRTASQRQVRGTAPNIEDFRDGLPQFIVNHDFSGTKRDTDSPSSTPGVERQRLEASRMNNFRHSPSASSINTSSSRRVPQRGVESAARAVMRSPVSSDSSDAPGTPATPSNPSSSKSLWSRFKDRLQDKESPRAPKPSSPKVHGLDEFIHPEHGRPVPRSIGSNAALFHHDSKRIHQSSKLAKGAQTPDDRSVEASGTPVSTRKESKNSSTTTSRQSSVRRVTSQQLPVSASAQSSPDSTLRSEQSGSALFGVRQPPPVVAVAVIRAHSSSQPSSHQPHARFPVANMAHISEVVSQESAIIPVAPPRKPLVPLAPVEFMTPGELRCLRGWRLLRSWVTLIFLFGPVAASPMYSGSLKYPWLAYIIGGGVGLLVAYLVFWLFGKPVNHYVLHKYLIWQDQCRELGLDAPPIINDDSKPTGLFSMAEPSPHSTTFPQSPSIPSRVSERKQHGFFEGTLTAGVGDDVISLDAMMGSGDPPAIGAPKEVKTPPRARVAAFSNFESESPAGPPESFGDWALGHPRVATAVGLYGPGGTAVAIRTDSAAATGRSAAFPSLSKAKDSRSNLDYAVASPTAERLYQAANLRGPSDPSHRNVGLFGMELDDGEALQFWHAALLEADKVVKEHEKAISVAERRGTKGPAMEELHREHMFWQSARVEAESQIMQLQAGTYHYTQSEVFSTPDSASTRPVASSLPPSRTVARDAQVNRVIVPSHAPAPTQQPQPRPYVPAPAPFPLPVSVPLPSPSVSTMAAVVNEVDGERPRVPSIGGDECSICLNALYTEPCPGCEATSSEPCKVSKGMCGHRFHTHCILEWLSTCDIGENEMLCPFDKGPWDWAS